MVKKLVQQIAEQEQFPIKELENIILGIEDSLEQGLKHPELYSYVMLPNLLTFKPTKKTFYLFSFLCSGEQKEKLQEAYERKFRINSGLRRESLSRSKSAKKLLHNRTAPVGDSSTFNRSKPKELLGTERDED